jgi:hypothetical protein
MANSIKDMIGSVDWGKMLTSPDARNALIGTALGGALLGGASMMQERDPEESKFVPVRDALAGALLGGIAGYGIPKGLSLFRDPGSLAPDGDVLKSNYLGWGAGGALAGAGLVGLSMSKTLDRARDRLREQAARRIDGQRAMHNRMYQDAVRAGAPQAEIDRLRGLVEVTGPNSELAARVIGKYRRDKYAALLRRDTAAAEEADRLLTEALKTRNRVTRGYVGFKDLMAEVARESENGSKARNLFMAILDKPWKRIRGVGGPAFSHGAHYKAAPFWGIWNEIPMPDKAFMGKLRGKRIGVSAPYMRPFVRAGKYAGLGAVLGMLAHKFFGPTPSDNYRK